MGSIQDTQFQLKLLNLLTTDEKFARRFASYIERSYFEDRYLAEIASVLIEFARKYRTAPSVSTIKTLLEQQQARRSKNLSVDEQQEYDRRFVMIEHVNKRERVWVQDHFVEWLTNQSLKAAVLASAEAIAQGNYHLVRRLIDDALKKPAGLDEAYQYFDDIYSRIANQSVRQTVETGWPTIDSHLGGGLGYSEMGVILAAPNAGKTTTLVNLGAAAVFRGLLVLHLFAEGTINTLANRYDARFTEVSTDKVAEIPGKIQTILQSIKQKHKGNLLLKSFNPRGLTVSGLRSFISTLPTAPQMIIVDYADRLKPESRYKDWRFEIAQIYEDLISVAREFKCALWTASQPQRQAANKYIITMENLSESYDKAAIVDVIIALCQRREEYEKNTFRFSIAKNRNARGRQQVHMRFDYHYQTMTENANQNLPPDYTLMQGDDLNPMEWNI